MEKYSVLKTPVYPKVLPSLTRQNYSERSGYSLTYYEPVYDLDLKIPGLGMAQVPFIPIQHTRKNRGRRPFVPRHLTEEDMKQINLKATQRAKDVMKDFEPATKPSFESSRDFRTYKEIESKIEDIREVYADVREHAKRIKKFEFSRKYLTNGATPFKYVDKDKSKDVVLHAYEDHLKDISKNLVKDRNHRRERFRYKAAGWKNEEKKVEKCKKEEEKEEKLKIPESQTDCFEISFGKSLSKLRSDLNALKLESDSFIDNTRYKSLNVDDVMKKF